MFSIIEHIMGSINSKTTNFIPIITIYEQRIECFKNLASLQEQLKLTDEEYVHISSIEGKAHTNAYERLEGLINKYRKEYQICEKIIKY